MSLDCGEGCPLTIFTMTGSVFFARGKFSKRVRTFFGLLRRQIQALSLSILQQIGRFEQRDLTGVAQFPSVGMILCVNRRYVLPWFKFTISLSCRGNGTTGPGALRSFGRHCIRYGDGISKEREKTRGVFYMTEILCSPYFVINQ